MIDTKPYAEGRQAYNAGKQRDTNPYPAGSAEWRDWLTGFNHEQEADLAS